MTTTTTTTTPAAPMTYSEAFARLTTEFATPDLTARNLLQTAFKGQSAWFGGSQSPYRLVHDRGATRENGYRVLADGFVIRPCGAPECPCTVHFAKGDAALAALRAALIAAGVTADSPARLDPEAERLAAQERQS